MHVSPATRRSLVNFGDRVGTANAYLIIALMVGADGRRNDCRGVPEYLARVLLGRIRLVVNLGPAGSTSANCPA
jgi:hypothetical protein